MSDLKCLSTICPQELTYRHMLGIPSHRRQSTIIERKRTEHKAETQPEMQPKEIGISSTKVANRRRTSSPMFANDEEFEEYLDAELCDTLPVSQTVLEEPVITVYTLACKKFNVLPHKCVKKALLEQTLKCRDINLRYDDCKSICSGLLNNRFVAKLDFQQNGMGPGPAVLIAEVIKESSFLTHIKIADNALKSHGAKLICEAACSNIFIKCLDLSGNGLVESDGEYFQKLIKSSESLRELYLGHNELMDEGVRMISKALKNTVTLRVLDLSWNHIRLQGAVAIGEALAKNASLETVNLAWNGLYLDGAKSVAEALKKNSTLENLDLTCNRLTEYCIAQILVGLSCNTTLETLRIGQNHVSTKGAFTILEQLKDNTNSGIKLIDFGRQEVQDKFEELYNEMKTERDIKVLYGEVWKSERSSLSNSGANDDEAALLRCNPLVVLMESMRLQNMRLIDFFKSLDSDKSNLICIDELCDGMLKVGVPIRRDTLLKLLLKLDTDNNKRLDYGEMVEAQNKHRKYMRKVFANAEVDFERTEVGKVTTLLRKFMGHNFIMKKGAGGNRLNVNSHRRNRSTSRPNTSRESGVELQSKMNGNVADKSGTSSRTSSASSIDRRGGSGIHTALPNVSLLADGSSDISRRSSVSSNESEVCLGPGSGSPNGSIDVTNTSSLVHNDERDSSQQVSNEMRLVSRPNSSSSIRSNSLSRLPSIPVKGGRNIPSRPPSSSSNSSNSGSSRPPSTSAGNGRRLSRSRKQRSGNNYTNSRPSSTDRKTIIHKSTVSSEDIGKRSYVPRTSSNDLTTDEGNVPSCSNNESFDMEKCVPVIHIDTVG